MIRSCVLIVFLTIYCLPLLSQRWLGPRDAQISGTVLDENDTPISAQIALYQFIVHDGRLVVMLGCATSAGAMGNFLCQHLRPGAYLIVATQLRETRQRNKQSSTVMTHALPLFVRYPAIPDIGYSDLIHLTDNDAESVIVQANSDLLTTLSVLSRPDRPTSLVVSIEAANVNIPIYTSTHQNPGGYFTLQHLPYGTYHLTEHWTADDHWRESVGTVNADGVQSAATTLVDAGPYGVTGSVQYLHDTVQKSSEIFLTSANPRNAVRYAATVKKDGNFRFRSIPGGSYYLSFALGSGSYIESVSEGGQSLVGNELTITDTTSQSPLTITATPAMGVIAGSLELQGDEAAPGVVLEAPSLHAFLLVHVSSSGRFRIVGLPPTDYRLYGWADTYAVPYRDEIFERRNSDKATDVDLETGTTSSDISIECSEPAL